MADIAQGKECENCHTLVACAGSFSDKELQARCPCCGRNVSMANFKYIPSHSSRVEALSNERDDLRSRVDVLEQELALARTVQTPQPAQTPSDDEQLYEGTADGVEA